MSISLPAEAASFINFYLHVFLLKPTEDLRNSFRFKFYILVGKIYKVHCHSIFFMPIIGCYCFAVGFSNFLSLLPYLCLFVSGCKLQHKNADPRKKLSNDSDEAIIYTKPEDEIFHRVLIPKLCPPTKKKSLIYVLLFLFGKSTYIMVHICHL